MTKSGKNSENEDNRRHPETTIQAADMVREILPHAHQEREVSPPISPPRKVSIIELDTDWFNGKQVLCFDDIITRGHSYATFASQLESFGANVLGGYFLARTHYNVNKQ